MSAINAANTRSPPSDNTTSPTAAAGAKPPGTSTNDVSTDTQSPESGSSTDSGSEVTSEVHDPSGFAYTRVHGSR